MITVTTRLRAAKGRDDELAQLLGALCEQLRAAPGCLAGEAARSEHDTSRFLLVSRFEDEAAHAAHANSEAYGELLAGLMDCLEQLPEIEIYRDL